MNEEIELDEEMGGYLKSRQKSRLRSWGCGALALVIIAQSYIAIPVMIDKANKGVDNVLMWAIRKRLGGMTFDLDEKTRSVSFQSLSPEEKDKALYFIGVSYRVCDKTVENLGAEYDQYLNAQEKPIVSSVKKQAPKISYRKSNETPIRG